MSAIVYIGDCLSVLPTLEAGSVDSIVTDPPYGLSFMGRDWDHGVPGVPFWVAALRVAKPGARLLAFGGTRTFHRLACAIEDAGWRIEDTLCWLYGSGFPKHRSKLKPGWEPVILARRPAKKATPLNIDACRIAVAAVDRDSWKRLEGFNSTPRTSGRTYGNGNVGPVDDRSGYDAKGRWPANVVLDEESAALLDEMSGVSTSAGGRIGKKAMGVVAGTPAGHYEAGDPGYGDVGGASRFYFTSKAARSEREAGMHGAPQKPGGSNAKGFTDDVAHGHDRNRPVANNHPTVKPLDLMQWLVRLITPSGGVVLDPFCGSGTTGCAALSEGMSFIGIEQDPEYAEIARQRIAHWGMQIAMPLIAEGGS